MNKKDLSTLKKQFKLENSFLDVKQVLNVYIKKDGQEVLTTRQNHFNFLEEAQQEIILKNFKKVITGNLNVKLFELNFTAGEGSDTEEILSQMMMAPEDDHEEFLECAMEFVQRIRENYMYDTDIVVSFIKFNYDTEESAYPFVMCSVSKMKKIEKELIFDFNNRDFDIKRELNPIINMKAPMDGFLYPLFEDERPNVGGILNYHTRTNKTNSTFISEVLKCDIILTAKEEKECFQQILSDVIGEKIKPEILHELYDILNNYFEGESDEEYKTIPRSMLERVLDEIGVEFDGDLSDIYLEVVGTEDYSFKSDNVIPDFGDKSVKVTNADTEIKFSPKNLDKVKQVKDEEGNMFLLLEISEDMKTDNFSLAVEEAQKIRFED